MFCLYWDAKTKKIHSLNGSGRSPKNTTLAQVRKELDIQPGKTGSLPLLSALSATVPGAAAGWCDTIEKYGSGKLTMEQILMPAIELAEKGFPVSQISAHLVSRMPSLRDQLMTSHSGRSTKIAYAMALPTSERCCTKIPRPKILYELLGLARLCRTLR